MNRCTTRRAVLASVACAVPPRIDLTIQNVNNGSYVPFSPAHARNTDLEIITTIAAGAPLDSELSA